MGMKPGGQQDLRSRLLFARVGWCQFYNETPGDEPQRGGSFNDGDIGSEFANFAVIKGRVYGYARTGLLLPPRRIAGNSADQLDDIAVALFATRENGSGQILVGWYRHATALPRGYKKRPTGADGFYRWSCAVQDAVLLPQDLRSVLIPKGKGGTGQSQVTYARDRKGTPTSAPWIKTARQFIERYNGPSLVGYNKREASEKLVTEEAESVLRGQDILRDSALRQAIEDYAMWRVGTELAKRYDEVNDVHRLESFDFHCRRGKNWQKIEVKGTRTAGDSLLFSNAEVLLAKKERVDLYVVSGIRITTEDDGSFSAAGGSVESIANWGQKRYEQKAIGWLISRH
jgi:hypothetical protein